MPGTLGVLHLDGTELFMMLGELCLPQGDEDCAPYASEIIHRINEIEWKTALEELPINWYVTSIATPESPID
jgi:hypothetical protein